MQPSAITPSVVNVLPVRSRIELWQILAERLNLQSWKWAADARAFSLPAMAINSTATSSLSQIIHWASDASAFALPAMALVSEASFFSLPQIHWDTEAGCQVSDVKSWGAQAEGSIAQTLQWATDVKVFALPEMTLNSLAVAATAQGEGFLRPPTVLSRRCGNGQ